jgi:molecular chaperone DnaK
MDNQIIVGIDLGTTNSVVSVLDENLIPRTIKIDNNKLLPSVVCYSGGTFIVGQIAKNMAILEPENTCLSVKRKMGQNITIKLGDKELRPEEVSALILRKIKNAVISELGLKVDQLRSVITVPAYFTEVQREATKQAAELAGLKVERIINEPTSASLAFGLNKMDDAIYAVYDLGGGTFDISIVENNAGIIEVLASTGDNMLGGDDFDLLLADFIWDKFITHHHIKVERTKKIDARLIKIAEETKIELSQSDLAQVRENFFFKHQDTAYHLEVDVTRKDFENLIMSLIDKTVSLIEHAINDAKIDTNQLEGIILVGGSSRIPLVSALIEERIGIIPNLIDLPDEAVSHGATIQGAIINHIDVDTILIDITPHSLGIKALANDPREDFEELFNNGNFQRLQEGFKERFMVQPIIPRNTPIPAKRSERFGAVIPFQKAYQIEIYQGEHELPEQNKLIGECLFSVKNPVDHGSIDVTFELDLNGILKMTAVQIGTDDIINSTFKSSRGIKTIKNDIEQEIVSFDESEKTLLNRAESLLKTKQLNDEDEEELTNLIEKYKECKINNTSMTEVESELLDLLYYLEGENENL